MTLKDLKDVIPTIPSEFDDCDIVYSIISDVNEETGSHRREDLPLVGFAIDPDTKELFFMDSSSMDIFDNLSE